MTEKILEPRGIRDEIIDILKTVDKYGYCLDSDIEWQADRIMEAYAAQQSKIKLPNPSIEEIERMAVDNFSSTVYADIISWTIRWMHKEAQQSNMPTDTESEKASRDFALRIFDDRTQKVRIADTMWGWQKCFEWLRNQIEKR